MDVVTQKILKEYCLKLIEKVDAHNVKHYSKLLTEFEYQISVMEQEEPIPNKCDLYKIEMEILYNSINFIDQKVIKSRLQDYIKHK